MTETPLADLIDRYWQLAYAEGRQNRQHDTEDGAAQECRSAIDAAIAALQNTPPPSSQLMGSEPVAWTMKDSYGCDYITMSKHQAALWPKKTPLYAAQPAPAEHVVGIIAAFEQAHPEFYWHIAKGKITAGEPLYGAIITTIMGTEIGHGESDVSADDAFRIAIDAATSRIRAGRIPEDRCGMWGPIKTAPRDGTVILLCGGAYHGYPFSGKWDLGPFEDTDRPWLNVINNSRLYEHVPQKWMPLPAALATATEGSGE